MLARGWPRQRLRSGRIYKCLRIWQRTLAPEKKWCRLRLGVRTTHGWNISGNALRNTINAERPSTPARLLGTAPQHRPRTRRLTKSLFGGALLASSPTQCCRRVAKGEAKSKPMTEKDHKKLAKTVKDDGKKRAKKKAAEAAKKS